MAASLPASGVRGTWRPVSAGHRQGAGVREGKSQASSDDSTLAQLQPSPGRVIPDEPKSLLQE